MATIPNSAESFPDWSPKAKEMAAEAKVLSGNKLEQRHYRGSDEGGKRRSTLFADGFGFVRIVAHAFF